MPSKTTKNGARRLICVDDDVYYLMRRKRAEDRVIKTMNDIMRELLQLGPSEIRKGRPAPQEETEKSSRKRKGGKSKIETSPSK